MKWRWALLATAILWTGIAEAQECVPGPQCTAAGNRAIEYQAVQQGRLSGGGMQAAEAGVVTYCTAKVMAEVSRVCADEMMAAGRSDCASLAYQQMEALLQQAAGAQASAEAFSQYSGPIDQSCGW